MIHLNKLTVDLSPEQLANAFFNMNTKDKAQFINTCGELFNSLTNPYEKTYDLWCGDLHCAEVVQDGAVNSDGRRFSEAMAGNAFKSSLHMPWPYVRDSFVDRIIEEVLRND